METSATLSYLGKLQLFIAALLQSVKYGTTMFLLSFIIFTGRFPLLDSLGQALQARLSHSRGGHEKIQTSHLVVLRFYNFQLNLLYYQWNLLQHKTVPTVS